MVLRLDVPPGHIVGSYQDAAIRSRTWALLQHPLPVVAIETARSATYGRPLVEVADLLTFGVPGVGLVSRRLLACFHDAGVAHRTHPVQIIAARGRERGLDGDDWVLFELLDSQGPLFDPDRGTVGVPSDGLPPMFRVGDVMYVTGALAERLQRLGPPLNRVTLTEVPTEPRPERARRAPFERAEPRAPSWIDEPLWLARDAPLLEAVVEDLDNVEPRNVLADQLLERGAPFGRLLRLGLEHERFQAAHPGWRCAEPSAEHQGLHTWAEAVTWGPYSFDVFWEGGLPYGLGIGDKGDLEGAADSVLARALRSIGVTEARPLDDLRTLLGHPHLARVHRLQVRRPEQVMPLLAAAPQIRHAVLWQPWLPDLEEGLPTTGVQRCEVNLLDAIDPMAVARLDVPELHLRRWYPHVDELIAFLEALGPRVQRVTVDIEYTAAYGLALERTATGWTLGHPPPDRKRPLGALLGWVKPLLDGGLVTAPASLDPSRVVYVLTRPPEVAVLDALPPLPVMVATGKRRPEDRRKLLRGLPSTIEEIWHERELLETPAPGVARRCVGNPKRGVELKLHQGPGGSLERVELATVAWQRSASNERLSNLVTPGTLVRRMGSPVADPRGWTNLTAWCAEHGLRIEE